MSRLAVSTIRGYADRLSVAPGEPIEFKISSDDTGVRYAARVVRMVNGDTNPAGPGFQQVEVAALGDHTARFQDTVPGSYVEVADESAALAVDGALTLHAFVQPTLVDRADQVVLGRYAAASGKGYELTLRAGRPTLVIGDGQQTQEVPADEALHPRCWYSVAATVDPVAGTAAVDVRSVVNSANSLLAPIVSIGGEGRSERRLTTNVGDAGLPFLIGAHRPDASAQVGSAFNGKIDSPAVWGRALSAAELEALATGARVGEGLVARWDFARGIGPAGIPTDRVADVGPQGADGRCVNFPARAVTGWNWRGEEENFIHAPEEYGAIHFHENDLEDCGWDTDVSWDVPPDLPSGVYALHMVQGDSEDWIPFFVLPPRGTATARALLVVPTASYLAYANEHFNDIEIAQSIFGRTAVIDEHDFWLHARPQFGLSTYDLHTDGSGVHYSSARRPIINMRPKFRTATGGPWQLPADLHLVAWLGTMGFEFDVVTDREVHDEGASLLSRYKVVLTGSHPEYCSTEMLDAWEQYLAGGGRGMYLGANGFYWITNWHPEKKDLIEVRKAELGSRAWQAQPGEYHLQTNGRRSGVWRGRSRMPQKLFGTGFSAEGFDESSYYVQMPDTRHPEAAFIMEGIDPHERIGDFGLVGGGAAGSELDRYDLSLGTPPETLLLAASEGHSDNYPRVVEEILFNLPMVGGTMDPHVRADIVYFTTKEGGAVFSSSSIAWCGSLLEYGGDNNVSRMTANVLRRFMDDEPLPPVRVAETPLDALVDLAP